MELSGCIQGFRIHGRASRAMERPGLRLAHGVQDREKQGEENGEESCGSRGENDCFHVHVSLCLDLRWLLSCPPPVRATGETGVLPNDESRRKDCNRCGYS